MTQRQLKCWDQALSKCMLEMTITIDWEVAPQRVHPSLVGHVAIKVRLPLDQTTHTTKAGAACMETHHQSTYEMMRMIFFFHCCTYVVMCSLYFVHPPCSICFLWLVFKMKAETRKKEYMKKKNSPDCFGVSTGLRHNIRSSPQQSNNYSK